MAWSPLAGGRLFDETCQDERVLAVREAMRQIGKSIGASLDQVRRLSRF